MTSRNSVFQKAPLSLFFLLMLCGEPSLWGESKVKPGIDILIRDRMALLSGKRVGLITNQTGVNSRCESTITLLKGLAAKHRFKLVALFAPEHGLHGSDYAEDFIPQEQEGKGGLHYESIPVHSLTGMTRRPTKEMLSGIDLLIYDIQDIGSRSYTFVTTLLLVMEEAAAHKIKVVVLDRPNPLNGLIVDGPVLEESWRSHVGYLNIPYCHGMTVGEIARYFNGEYNVGCNLEVIPMEGWLRQMTFSDTGLYWIPTSPHVPEASTTFYYPTTGILGTLKLVNTGVWYSLPFRLVGAPWIKADRFAQALNAQGYPGVYFQPFYYRPYYGRYAHQQCQGVNILITDHRIYLPFATQGLLIGMLKSLYPEQFKEAIAAAHNHRTAICNLCGTEEVYRMITGSHYIVWPLRSLHKEEREAFLERRRSYLMPEYGTLPSIRSPLERKSVL